MVIFGSSLRLTDCMRQQELKLSLLRLELIQGPLCGTGENEPSFKIVRTVTSGYTPRCYNWGLFREGRFSQPPSCELSPVVISHARRREGFAVAEHGLPHRVRRSLASDTAGLDGPFPTATFWFANPTAIGIPSTY